MSLPLVVTFATSSLTALFLALLFVERRNRTRYLSGVRGRMDAAVAWVHKRILGRLPRIHSGVVRATFHYVTHQVLSLMLRVLRFFEMSLERIVHINRKKAHTVRSSNNTHLKAIADHKESVSLSAAEKRKRKNDALKGGV